MSDMYVQLESRAFQLIPLPKDIGFSVNSLEWSVYGGCKQATITASGTVLGLWDLLEYLRCPIKIFDKQGTRIWWGYVHEVKVKIGGMEVGISIKNMANAVAVAYSYVRPGTNTVGQRKTTTYLTDTDSITEFGRKEFLSSQGGMSQAAANARRAAILASSKYPHPVINAFGASRKTKATQRSATITCRGWWDTLEWRMATIASVVGPNYSSTTSTEQNIGSASTDTKVFQQVLIGTKSVNVIHVSAYVRKQGTPTDNLQYSIYALDSSGLPTGSALASASIGGASVSASLGWVKLALTSEVELKANTKYGLQLSRSGAASGTNYFVVNVNTDLGYTDGFFRIWNGSAWVARSTDADMPFILYVDNKIQSTQQIKDLESLFGEFLTGVIVDADSGVILPSYRDGDTTVLQEILDLMASGGVNGRRLLADVTPERLLHIYEEPASTTVEHFLDSSGKIRSTSTRPVPDYLPPVGKWVKLTDIIPVTVDLSRMINPTLQFMDGAIYDTKSGLRPQFRGQNTPDDLLKVIR